MTIDYNGQPVTHGDIDLLAAYWNVADETYPIKIAGVWASLELKDLDPAFVAEARMGATRFGLSWPPYMPEVEEFELDHRFLSRFVKKPEFHTPECRLGAQVFGEDHLCACPVVEEEARR